MPALSGRGREEGRGREGGREERGEWRDLVWENILFIPRILRNIQEVERHQSRIFHRILSMSYFGDSY